MLLRAIGDFETADAVMPNIPKDYRNRVAQFLEKQGFKEQALVVSNDDEHKCVHSRAFCCLPSFLPLSLPSSPDPDQIPTATIPAAPCGCFDSDPSHFRCRHL